MPARLFSPRIPLTTPLWFALCLLYLLTWQPPQLAAQETPTLEQKLAGLPQPWQEKLHRLTLKEYTETLKYWE